MTDTTSPEITREFLATEHPALLASIEGAAQQAGIDAERTRVAAITEAAAAAPHARTVADAAIVQGLTAEQATAMIGAVPEPAKAAQEDTAARDDYRAAFLADGNQAAPTADSATGEQSAPSDPDAAAKAKWDSDAALRAEFASDFGRYQAFQTAQASGRVKILRK